MTFGGQADETTSARILGIAVDAGINFLDTANAYRISTIVYNPLVSGLLTGKHRRDEPEAGTRFDNNQMYLDRYWHNAMFDAVDALLALAAHEERTPVSVALNWILHHTVADC